jgi:7-carboxy-7-deazaguanine synthase
MGYTMKVCEIFTSIQGESSFAGEPCMFIRMTGCNLRCSYCDTKYAYHEGEELSEKSIIIKVKTAGIQLVEITGGEPLLQKGVGSLMKRLLDEGFNVLIETNGSLPINDIDKRAVVILDIKTPGSGMSDKMDFSNIDYLKNTDEIKFVITDMVDYEWSKDVIITYDLTKKCHLLLSPTYGMLDPQDLIQWMLEDRIHARLNLQLHKYIFGPDARGK